jgi:hypothetical protein
MTTYVPEYPEVYVQLTGQSGNVFFVIGKVSQAIRQAHGQEAARKFQKEARACEDYDHVLQLCIRTVHVL